MDFLKIAWRDISSIFKNRFIRVSVTAIIIVPLLYSMLYLYAFWDPYSKLEKMPVAVVNMDKGSVNDNANYGKDIIEELKKNTQIGWRFVDLEEAKKGLKGNGYYAMFVIPEDFSSKVLSAKEGNLEQPQIVYTSNDKKNFIASQINGKVMLELKDKIIKNITKEYTKVVFDKLYEVKDGMIQTADGSKKLNDGIVEIKDGSIQLNDGIKKLNSNIPLMSNGVKELYDGSKKVENGLIQGKNGSAQITNGLKLFKEKTDSMNSLIVKNPQFKDILKPENLNSAKKLMIDATILKDADTTMLNVIPMVMEPKTMESFNKMAIDFKAVDFNSLTKISQVKELMKPENIQNMSKLMKDVDELSKVDIVKLQPIMALLNNSEKINKILVDANGLSNVDLNKMQGFLNTQKAEAEQFIKTSNVLNYPGNKEALIKAIQSNTNVDSQQKVKLITLVEGYNKLTTGTAESMKASVSTLDTMSYNIQTLGVIQKELNDNTALINGIQVALSKENVAYLNTVIPKLISMKQDINSNAQNINELKELMMQFNTNGELKQSIDKILVLEGDLETVKPVLQKLQTSLTQEQMKNLENSPTLINNLLQMQKDLKNNEKLLEVAQSALSDKNIDMAKGIINQMPELTNGVNKLYVGSVQLFEGINRLQDGESQLSNGLGELNIKIPELAYGTNKLYNGSIALSDGMVKLANGSKEFNEKISEGADKLNKNLKNSSKEMGEFVSEPINIDEKPINHVENYGTGFAPYFIPLSLWVGALMMFFVITDKVDSDINASSASLVAGKFLSYGYIGIIQALFASIVVLMLGLKPDSIVLYFIFNIFMSFVFIAIIQSFVFLFGEAGRLFAIILLILQLTSCAGTFPLEVVPNFFKVLNPLMPFTYCVSALREIISGVDYAVLGKDFIVLAVILVVFLVISILMKGHADKVQQRIKEKKNNMNVA